MAKKHKLMHKKKMTVPLAVVAGFAPLGVMVYNRRGEGLKGMADELVGRLTGFKIGQGWYPWLAASGLAPIFGGLLIHKLAGKFGINRALAGAGIPFIRV